MTSKPYTPGFCAVKKSRALPRSRVLVISFGDTAQDTGTKIYLRDLVGLKERNSPADYSDDSKTGELITVLQHFFSPTWTLFLNSKPDKGAATLNIKSGSFGMIIQNNFEWGLSFCHSKTSHWDFPVSLF